MHHNSPASRQCTVFHRVGAHCLTIRLPSAIILQLPAQDLYLVNFIRVPAAPAFCCKATALRFKLSLLLSAPSSLQFRLVPWNWKIEEAAFVRRNSLHRLHTFAAKWLSSRGTFSIKAFAATRKSYGILCATDSHSKRTTRIKT